MRLFFFLVLFLLNFNRLTNFALFFNFFLFFRFSFHLFWFTFCILLGIFDLLLSHLLILFFGCFFWFLLCFLFHNFYLLLLFLLLCCLFFLFIFLALLLRSWFDLLFFFLLFGFHWTSFFGLCFLLLGRYFFLRSWRLLWRFTSFSILGFRWCGCFFGRGFAGLSRLLLILFGVIISIFVVVLGWRRLLLRLLILGIILFRPTFSFLWVLSAEADPDTEGQYENHKNFISHIQIIDKIYSLI